MAIKLSKWNSPVGVIAPAAGTIGGGAATGSTAATDAAGGAAGRGGIMAAGRVASVAAGGTAGGTSPEAARRTASDEEEVAGGAAGRIAVVATEVAGNGSGNIGAENMEPTAVVPKNWGTDGAKRRGGRLRRAASDAGMDPEMAAPEAEAVMASSAAAGRVEDLG